jgi:hypothetical protein
VRIRDPVPFLIPCSGIRIRDEHPGSYFQKHRNIFFGLKILKFFDADPGMGSGSFLTLDPGWKKFGSGIWDKHPGSATLLKKEYPFRFLKL